MKKILGLTVAALIIIAMVGGGTWAYFSDTESSPDNSLTAGTLDLTINSGNDPYTILSLTDVAPGDSGSGSTTLANVGSLDGELDISTSAATNTESSGGTEYEGDGGDGELGAAAEIAVYIDVNQNATWDAGTDVGLKSDGTIYTTGSLLYDTINNYASKTWDPSNNGVETMAAGATDDFVVMWQIPTGTGNEIQGDQVEISFTFTLEQADRD